MRLLLVDSKVFAEEIEPTGAVPMELSLERYLSGQIMDFSSIRQYGGLKCLSVSWLIYGRMEL